MGLPKEGLQIFDAVATQISFEGLQHGINLVFDHDWRIVQLALLDQGIKYFVQIAVLAIFTRLFLQALFDRMFQVSHGLKIRAHHLRKRIVEFRAFVGFYAVDPDLKLCFFASVDAFGIFGPFHDKLFFFAAAHAQQFAVKTSRFHRVGFVERDLPILLVQHHCLFSPFLLRGDDAAHIHRKQILVLCRTCDFLPAGILPLVAFDALFDSDGVDHNWVFLDAQRPIVAQLDLWLQRHHHLVRQRFQLDILQRGLGVRFYFFPNDRLAKKLLSEFIDKLRIEVGQTNLLDDNVVGGFAFAEARNSILAGKFGCCFAQFLVNPIVRNFDGDRQLAIFAWFSGNSK